MRATIQYYVSHTIKATVSFMLCSVAMIKHQNQKQLKEKREYLSL